MYDAIMEGVGFLVDVLEVSAFLMVIGMVSLFTLVFYLEHGKKKLR
jgi:hypothetical protein